MREGIGSSDIDARPMAERPAMSREPLRSVSFMMRTVADDCFEVLCRDDTFKELACEGLLQLTFFSWVTPTSHKILLVRPNKLTENCCLSSTATVF